MNGERKYFTPGDFKMIINFYLENCVALLIDLENKSNDQHTIQPLLCLESVQDLNKQVSQKLTITNF